MKYAYYPGCSLNSTGIEYNLSAKAVAKHMGVELWEIPEWNCCGSSPAHKTDHLLALALPARNLAIAEKEGLDVAIPCASCFSRMKATEAAVRKSADTKETIASLIDMEYNASIQVYSFLDVMVNQVGLEAVKEKVVKPLTGLKVASYYGCLLVRPPKLTCFDDAEDPQSMDNLVEVLGGTPVSWAYKTECCGAGHSTTRPQVGAAMINSILRNAAVAGADCIVTACPLCLLNLDMRQSAGAQQYRLPVFYFTELMGLAMGYAPKEVGITTHFIDPVSLLESKDILRHPATRREDA
ncbi:MAG: CoB--CoM heterodisulfide reductase iron-sulfur subunit B family protein [Bacillota bacterium]